MSNYIVEFNMFFIYYRITPDHRATVYCAALRGGEQSDWDWAYARAKQTTSSRERSDLLYALGCTKVNDTLNR